MSRVVKKVRPKFHYVKSRQGRVIHLLPPSRLKRGEPVVVQIVFRETPRKGLPKKNVPYVIAPTFCGSTIFHGELVEPDGDHPDICRACTAEDRVAFLRATRGMPEPMWGTPGRLRRPQAVEKKS